MRERSNVFFQTPKEKQPNLTTNPVVSLEIILDPKTRQHSLISRLEYCGQQNGKLENTSISFDDAFVLEEAERCLQMSGTAKICSKGGVKISTKTWNFVWNIGCHELIEKEEGIIFCELTAKEGIIQSFSYKITDNNETSKSHESIPKEIIVRC